jgi:hypothetical protein
MTKKYGFVVDYEDIDGDDFGSRENNKKTEVFSTEKERDDALESFKSNLHFSWGYREINNSNTFEVEA